MTSPRLSFPKPTQFIWHLSPHIIKRPIHRLTWDEGRFSLLHVSMKNRRIITQQQEQKLSTSAANGDLKCTVMGLQLAHHVQCVYHIITVQSSITVLLLREDKVHSFIRTVILDSHAHICQRLHFHGGLSDRPADTLLLLQWSLFGRSEKKFVIWWIIWQRANWRMRCHILKRAAFWVFQGESKASWECHNMSGLLFCSLPSSCGSAVLSQS